MSKILKDLASHNRSRLDGGPGSGAHKREGLPPELRGAHYRMTEENAKAVSQTAFDKSDEARKAEEAGDHFASSVANRDASDSHRYAASVSREIGDTRGTQIHEQASQFHDQRARVISNARSNTKSLKATLSNFTLELPSRRYNEDGLAALNRDRMSRQRHQKELDS